MAVYSIVTRKSSPFLAMSRRLSYREITGVRPKNRRGNEMEDVFATKSHPLICPFCEANELRAFGHNSARCVSCGGLLSSAFLATLRRITQLPDAAGHHACECGHPEMRRLPDGVYWCPACGFEVVPVSPL